MARGTALIRLALFGHPVSRSLSPRIHQLFAGQTGLAVEYTARESTPDTLSDQLAALAGEGGRGCNITVPLKNSACALAHRLSARARQSGAVNTLRLENGDEWFGDNTDGIGLIRDITRNLGKTLSGQRIALIGAGGAAAGILFDILISRPARVVMSNRTLDKAIHLAQRFANIGPVEVFSEGQLSKSGPFDLVLNATSMGHQGGLPAMTETMFAPGAVCYDLNYGTAHEVLDRWCVSRGIASHGGLGMLVEQAAESFQLWTGHAPETASVIDSLSTTASTARN